MIQEPPFKQSIFTDDKAKNLHQSWHQWLFSLFQLWGKFGNVKAGNYSEFEADGTLIKHGNATTWRDDNFAGVALAIGASAPDLIAFNGGTVYVRAFDGNVTMEQLFGGTEYNHEGKEGADISLHLHWAPTTANTGNVKWQAAYWWFNANDASPGAETIISVVQAAGGVAWKPQKIAFPTVSGAGKKIGSQIGIRLFRDPSDAADTYPNDAVIAFTFGIHYECDSDGSREITTK
jgi:hypothetical protein